MAITHVCLSDLHLGAAYSLLTQVDTDGTVRPDVANDVLTDFVEALIQMVSVQGLTGAAKPKLVLLGDVVDFAFASVQEAALGFRTFITPLIDSGEFADQIIFVPGNHDHSLWEAVRDNQFIQETVSNRNGGSQVVPVLQHSTSLYSPTLSSDFLDSVLSINIKAKLGGGFLVAYPNYGIHCQNSNRTVVMHHGHYIESMYRAVTEFINWIVADGHAELDVNDIERQNGAWIDFLWSSFGDSDRAGDTAFELYKLLQNAHTAHELTQHVAGQVLEQGPIPMNGAAELAGFKGLTVAELIQGLMDGVIGTIASRERNDDSSVLTPSSFDGLKWYLNGPMYRQIQKELGNVPAEVSFIFGHTHKPFVETVASRKYAHPVNVFNTGGWALDHPAESATQGASVVLIDDECHAVSMQLVVDGTEPFIPQLMLCKPSTDMRGRVITSASYGPFVDEVLYARYKSDFAWVKFSKSAAIEIHRLRRRMAARSISPGLAAESIFRRRRPEEPTEPGAPIG